MEETPWEHVLNKLRSWGDIALDMLPNLAVAVAADDQAAVKRWVDDGSLRRTTPDETKGWDADPVAFHAIIVQPFVLCRPIEIEPVQG
jgi:hypothetical protein